MTQTEQFITVAFRVLFIVVIFVLWCLVAPSSKERDC